MRQRNHAIAYKMGAVVLLTLAFSYSFVPLYQMFCQVTGYAGTTQKSGEVLAKRAPDATVAAKEMVVHFNSDVSPNLAWRFEPSQSVVKCRVGEPVLAFFK